MLILTPTQQSNLSVEYVDANGNLALVDGDPVWSVSDPTVAEIVPGPTPFEVTVRATGVTGTTQVSVIADADLGDGLNELIEVLDVTVGAGEAVNANITTAAPTEQEVVVEDPVATAPAADPAVVADPAVETPVDPTQPVAPTPPVTPTV